MGFFNKIRKALRKGGALPHEHGPVVKLAGVERKPNGKFVEIKVDVVKSPSTKADCVCGGGTCKCDERKKVYAEAVAKKQKEASKTKPVAKPAAKKPAAKKPVAKKDTPSTAKKSAPKKK